MSHRIGPDDKSLRIDQDKCLNCGEPLTGVAALDGDAKPGEGDIMVCLYCSHVMEWTGERLVELSDEAIREMAGDPDMLEAVKFTSACQRWAKDNPR